MVLKGGTFIECSLENVSYEASIYATNTSFKTLVISEENHYGAMEHFEKFNTEFTAGKKCYFVKFCMTKYKDRMR